MASSFRRDDPILHFGPRLSAELRWSQRRYLLWPALMYRVVAPEVRERKLNVIQKAVLGMCRAGTTSAERIGSRLRIHTDLAALVLVELQEQGALGRNGIPTQKGRELFEDEALKSHRLVTGHVFQDPWNGELWPRFVERLDYVELHDNLSGFPDLVLGSKGKPRRERAFMCLPGDLAIPPAPQPSEVLRAARRHRSALRGAASLEANDDENPQPREDAATIERVSLVDDHPTPVFLTSFVFIPETGNIVGEWFAADPFGLGSSPALRKAIDREILTSALLSKMVESMFGESLDSQLEKQRRWTADVRTQAIMNVDRAFSVNVRDQPNYSDLVDLEYARVEVDLLRIECPQHKLRDLLGAGRKVLEGTIRAIAERHPPRDAWRRLYSKGRPVEDRDYSAGVYESSAKAIGFHMPLPKALAGVIPQHVKGVCSGQTWRLRAAIVTAVLAARDDLSHPLRRAATEEPALLSHLDNVASAAGEALHAGTGDLEIDSVLRVIAAVQRAVGLLTGLSVSQPTVEARR
jgi:hypothetical protein